MRRREFIGLIGGAAAWPVVAHSQQPGRIPVVSILWHGTEERELANPFYHWVVQGFENAGLKPGVNVIIDHQFADESDAKYNRLAPQMVARRPDVLVAITLPPTLALMKRQLGPTQQAHNRSYGHGLRFESQAPADTQDGGAFVVACRAAGQPQSAVDH